MINEKSTFSNLKNELNELKRNYRIIMSKSISKIDYLQNLENGVNNKLEKLDEYIFLRYSIIKIIDGFENSDGIWVTYGCSEWLDRLKNMIDYEKEYQDSNKNLQGEKDESN